MKSANNISGFKKYLNDIIYIISEKGISLVLSFFVSVWLIRYLGPDQFGAYSYAISLSVIFMSISNLGVDNILIRELVKQKYEKNLLMGSAFLIKLFGFIFAFSLLYFFLSITSNTLADKFLILVIGSASIFSSFHVIGLFFTSQIKNKYITYSKLIVLVIISILKIIFIMNQYTLFAFGCLFLVDGLLLSLTYIYFYVRNKLHIKEWKFERTMALKLLKDGLPLALSGIFISIYMKIDQVMLKEMLGVNMVGQYAAAARISEIWYVIPVAITTSLFPAIINSKKQDLNLYNERMRQLYSLMIFLAFFIVIPIFLYGDWLVGILFNEAYVNTGALLKIHIFSAIFVFIGVVSNKWLITENLQIFLALNTLIGVIINVTLNYVLIKNMGVSGAAWATLISQIVASYLCLFLWKKTRINFFIISRSFLIKDLKYIKEYIKN